MSDDGGHRYGRREDGKELLKREHYDLSELGSVFDTVSELHKNLRLAPPSARAPHYFRFKSPAALRVSSSHPQKNTATSRL